MRASTHAPYVWASNSGALNEDLVPVSINNPHAIKTQFQRRMPISMVILLLSETDFPEGEDLKRERNR
jgi:hypothetical protein